MNNFADAEGAASDASGAMNELDEANAKYVDSITGRLQQLEASFQEFSQDLLDSGLVKTIVQMATAFVDWSDGIVKVTGALPALSGALAGVLTLKNFDASKIINAFSTIKKYNEAISNATINVDAFAEVNNITDASLIKYLKSLTTQMKGVNGATEQAKASMWDYVTGLAAVGAEELWVIAKTIALKVAMGAIVSILSTFVLSLLQGFLEKIDDVIHAYDKLKEKATNAKDDYESQTSDIEDLNKQLDTLKEKIAEFDDKTEVGVTVDAEELEKLKEQNAELEAELKLKQALAALDADDANEAAYGVATAKNHVREVYNGDSVEEIDETNTEYLEYQIGEYEKLYEKRQDLDEQIKNAKSDEDAASLKKQRDSVNSQMDDLYKSIASTYKDIDENQKKAINAGTKTDLFDWIDADAVEAAEAFNTFYDRYIDTADNISETTEAALDTEPFDDFIKAWQNLQDFLNNSDIPKSYGNIDNTNRQAVKWTSQNLAKYSEAAQDYVGEGNNPNQLLGEYSTAMGSSGNFEGMEIAFSPILQTEDGAVPLTYNQVYDYINDLVKKIKANGEEVTADNIIKYDATGLPEQVYGNVATVKGLIAGVEGQIVDGAKLSAADIDAIAGASEEELEQIYGHGSSYVGKSMHDVQGSYYDLRLAEVEASDAASDAATAAGLSTEEYSTKVRDAKNATVDTATELDNLNTKIDGLQTAYKTLNTAVDEYNKYGYLSMDTMQSLLELDPKYLSCLIDQNGKLALNTSTIRTMTKARLEDAKATELQIALQEMESITSVEKAQEYLNAASTSVADAQDQLDAKKQEILGSLALSGLSDADLATISTTLDQIITNFTGVLQGLTQMEGGDISGILDGISSSSTSATSGLSELQSAYKSLSSAVKEYNQYGYISFDTLESLMNLDPQYLACLTDENGKLKLNTDTIRTMTKARLADAKATQLQLSLEKMESITSGTAAGKYLASATTAVENATDLFAAKKQEMIDNLLAQTSDYEEGYDIQGQIDLMNEAFGSIESSYNIVAKLIDSMGDANLDNLMGTSSTSKSATSLTSTLTTLTDAMKEYNRYGGLSLKTTESLLSLSDKYTSCLEEVNGKLTLNKEKLKTLAAAELVKLRATNASNQSTSESIKSENEWNRVIGLLNKSTGSATVTLEQLEDAINGVGTAFDEANTKINDAQNSFKTIYDIYNKLQNGEEVTLSDKISLGEIVTKYPDLATNLFDADGNVQLNTDTMAKAVESAVTSMRDAFDPGTTGYEYFDNLLISLETDTSNWVDQLLGADTALGTFNDTIDNVQSSFSTLVSAQEELNRYGSISLDTMQSLLGLNSSYFESFTSSNKDLQDYLDSLSRLENLSPNGSAQKYGNIDNYNRQVLTWDEDTISKYKDFVQELVGPDGDINSFLGSYSTAEGSDSNFGGLEIAYSPILQTDSGPLPLTSDVLTDYINSLIDKASAQGDWTAEDLLKLDATGLTYDINGTTVTIKDMLAAVEGEVVDGTKLTAADVAAIAGCTEEELIEYFGETSDYVGKSMHDVQSAAVDLKTSQSDLEEQAKAAGMTYEDYLLSLASSINIENDALRDLLITKLKDIAATETDAQKVVVLNKVIADLTNKTISVEDALDSMGTTASKAREKLSALKDLIEQLVDAALKVYEWNNDKKVDALNKEKDALEKTNDAQERAIKLAQLQDELDKAKANKTVRKYVEGQGYIWTVDESAIQDAQQALEDQKRQNAYQDQVDKLQAQIDAIDKEETKWSDLISTIKDVISFIETLIGTLSTLNTDFGNFIEQGLDSLAKKLFGGSDSSSSSGGGLFSKFTNWVSKKISGKSKSSSDATTDASSDSGGGLFSKFTNWVSKKTSGGSSDATTSSGNGFLNKISGVLDTAKTTITQKGSSLWNGLTGSASKAGETIKGIFNGSGGSGGVWNTILNGGSSLLSKAGSLLSGGGSIGSWITGTAIPAVTSAVTSAGSWLGDAAGTLTSLAPGLLSSAGTWLTGTAIPAITAAAPEIAVAAGAALAANAVDDYITQPLRDDLEEKSAEAKAAGDKTTGALCDIASSALQLTSPFSMLKGIFTGDTWDALKEGWEGTTELLSEAAGAVGNFASGVVTTVGNVVSGVWDGAKSVVSGVWNGAKSLASSAWKGVKSLFHWASGTTSVPKSNYYNVDEKGPEIIVRKPQSGRYTYLESGDGVVPADITKKLFEMGGSPDKWFKEELEKMNGEMPSSASIAADNSVTTGDIIINNPVGDVETLARRIKQELPSQVQQRQSKR